MKVPLKWLKDFVDIDVDAHEFAEAMTMSGSKVESVEKLGEDISGVVVGRIVSVEKHPDADKLLVTKVDTGNGEIQIITGAQNVKTGDYIPVALDGAILPGGKKRKKGKLRGLESNGMMCSIQELNLTKNDFPEADEDGIFILQLGLPLGRDIKEVLGLNDTVIDFEITPNRPDCLSVLGIAREASATLGKAFRKTDIRIKEEGEDISGKIAVEIQDSDLCPRYAARVIKNVKIEPSPQWMRERLRTAGVRPINNIVDITNYVMLELGQPMHSFDLKNIEGKKIVVRRARDGEKLNTLDDKQRELDSTMLVIADAERPVAVAGVMGGANSEITEDTTTILFESATFDGVSVRQTAKKLGMRTEASARFEKGLDPENVIAAVNRAVQLVEELGAGTVCKGIVDCYPGKREGRAIKFRPERINALIGADVSPETMIKIFKALEIDVDEANMLIKPPSFRADIEGEADLAEEVARFYDYNNIKATLLEGKAATTGKKSEKQKIEDTIRNMMVSCGLSEIYTYSFTSPKVFDMIKLPKESSLRKAIVISNPLGEDYSIMRTTTIPDMLGVISRNYSKRIEEAGLFELSYVYLPEDLPITKLPNEKLMLTIGMYGNVDFYDLKGIVEELLSILRIENYSFEPETGAPSFHPGRTARIMIGDQEIGLIGEIHPDVAENFEAPERVYVGTLEVMPLVVNASSEVSYKPLPKYPAVSRDIAMVIRDEILVRDIEALIKKKAGKIIEQLKLFDVYKGKQVPEGMKSVAYSITFRSEDRTLTDDEVTKAMDKILDGLRTEFGAQLR